MRAPKTFLALFTVVAAAMAFSLSALPQSSPKLKQFVYILKVTPAFHDSTKWTQKENEAVGRHFARLKQASAAGRVILAGKTSEPLESTFGLVVFEAEDDKVARQFMESDPAVEAGVMSATLHPYFVALQRTP